MRHFSNRNLSTAILAGVLIIAVFSIFSCSGESAKPVKIGVILPLTGLHASFGQAQKLGYEMALEEMNNGQGKKFLFIYEDDASNAQKAAMAVEKLIRKDRVLAIIGSYSSTSTASAAEIADYHKTPLVIDGAASDLITQKGSSWVFRINAPSSTYAKAAVDYFTSLKKIKTLGVLYESSLFGTTTAQYVEEYARAQGLKMVFFTGYDEKNMNSIPEMMPALKSKKPDAVVLISYLNDAVILMENFRTFDFDPSIYFSIGAAFNLREFIDKAGPNAEYIFNATQWSALMKWPESQAFVKKFQDRYKKVPVLNNTEAYSVAKVIMEAVNKAPGANRDSIRQSLLTIDLNTPLTAVGFKSFDGFTNQNSTRIIIQQIQNSNFVLLEPEAERTGKAVFPVPPWKTRPHPVAPTPVGRPPG